MVRVRGRLETCRPRTAGASLLEPITAREDPGGRRVGAAWDYPHPPHEPWGRAS